MEEFEKLNRAVKNVHIRMAKEITDHLDNVNVAYELTNEKSDGDHVIIVRAQDKTGPKNVGIHVEGSQYIYVDDRGRAIEDFRPWPYNDWKAIPEIARTITIKII